MQKCAFNEDKEGTGSPWGLSAALGPFARQTIQDTWVLVFFLDFHCLGPAPLLKTYTCVVLLYFLCFQNGTALAALWRIHFHWWLLTPEMQSGKMVGTKSYICWVNRGDPDQLGVFHNWSISGRHCNTLPAPYPENLTLIIKISYWSQDTIQPTQTHCTFSRTSHDFLWWSSPQQGTMQVDSLVNAFIS